MVVKPWIPLPSSLLFVDRAEPYVLPDRHMDEFRAYLSTHDAGHIEVDISAAGSVATVIESMKAVLPFPEWCGSSWDSIEDAFEDIRLLWRFPLVLLVHGLSAVLGKQQQLGLQVVLRLSELSHAFSSAGDQFVVVFVADT